MERNAPQTPGLPGGQAALIAGVAMVVVLGVVSLTSLPERPTAVTTIPDLQTSSIPDPTTTVPQSTAVTVRPWPSAGPVLGAGWEELDPGPIAGRHRMAVVWTDHGLFAWGGHDGYTQVPVSSLFLQDGFLYDPGDGAWTRLAETPQEEFQVGAARAVSMGARVLVYGQQRTAGTSRAAIYDLTAAAWIPVASEFADSLELDSPVVWTGRYLVAPKGGLEGRAYDPATGSTFVVPPIPANADVAVHSPKRVHWTGVELLAIGSGSVYAWVPGEEAWRTVSDPPVPPRARDSVWTADGLLVVNYQMATAVLDHDTNQWNRPGDLPLRFHECLPEAVEVAGFQSQRLGPAGGTPVVRMCSGLAVWDSVRSSWIPIPLSDLGLNLQGPMPLVGADDAIYTIGGPTFRRFQIDRAFDGSIVPPPTVPIGIMQLDIPDGWELISSFAPVQSRHGFVSEDDTIGLVFEEGDRSCVVASSRSPEHWALEQDAVLMGSIYPGGDRDLPGNAYWVTGAADDEWGILYLIPTGTSDWVTIRCSGPGRDTLSEAAASFGGLWSPWEEPVAEEPDLVIGTGWEEVYGGPVAGRGNLVAAWTGSRIFVWGVGLEAFVLDPALQTWVAAAPPPEGFCIPTRVSATWIDEMVLVHGAGGSLDGCSRAAGYDPVTDTWNLLNAEYFDRVSYATEAVWTGEWLAAPTAGVAWVAATGETIDIPRVPEAGWSQARFHWTGDRIVAVGSLGDVYTLVPGEDEWDRWPGPPLPSGRDSVWAGDELFVIQYDNLAARFDFTRWEEINLPLRFWECNFPDLLVVGGLPVARACGGLAIWDHIRASWIPIPLPMELSTGIVWPKLVATDDAIYAFGEKVLRYPIERLGDGSVANPPTIPVGVMQLDIPLGFSLRSTVGLARLSLSDGSVGEVVTFVLDGLGGSCLVDAWYGRELTEEQRAMIEEQAEGDWLVTRLSGTEPTGYWLVGASTSDTIWIDCQSPEDAEILAESFWLP